MSNFQSLEDADRGSETHHLHLIDFCLETSCKYFTSHKKYSICALDLILQENISSNKAVFALSIAVFDDCSDQLLPSFNCSIYIIANLNGIIADFLFAAKMRR